MLFHGLTGAALAAFHDEVLAHRVQPPGPRPPGSWDGPWPHIARNHLCNALLWDEEDRARRTEVPDREIVASKRAIDRHNQARNDAVEAIDAALLAALGEPEPAAPLHSETPGAMIDRLSILALKIHHMRREAGRYDAGAEHMRSCAAKLERLNLQRADLRDCFDRLLRALAEGQARFKVYRQYKMYNDPTLNPCLYQAASRGPQARQARG